jgi:hypothetical protein
VFYWDATGNATEHNGGTVISPLATFPTDRNNQTQLATWFDGSTLVGTGVWRRQYDGVVNVKWFGAKGDSNTDDTKSIQAAISNSTEVYFSTASYMVTSSLILSFHSTLIGEKANIINSSVNPIFLLETHVDVTNDVDAGITINGFYLYSKNVMRINRIGVDSNDFLNQTSIKNVTISNCFFFGTYSPSADINANTNVIPTYSELYGYGVGIEFNGVFDSIITMCGFTGFGIGTLLAKSDVNSISTNRYVSNARHIHTIDANTYGHQNKIINNDMLNNYRMYGIWFESLFGTIYDNYFETYTNAACHIYARGVAQIIENNRFDSSGTSTPAVVLAPIYGTIFANNRGNPGTVPINIVVDTSLYNSTIVNRAGYLVYFGENPDINIPTVGGCKYLGSNKYKLSSDSYTDLQGVKATSYPWSVGPVTGLQCITGGPDSLIFNLPIPTATRNLVISFNGAALIDSGGYCAIKIKNVTVFSDFVSMPKGRFGKKEVYIRLADDVTPNDTISFEVITSQMELVSIELLNKDYLMLSAPPTTSGNSTYEVGDRIVNSVPSSSNPKSWVCTVAGNPGTWVSEGNL